MMYRDSGIEITSENRWGLKKKVCEGNLNIEKKTKKKRCKGT